MTYDEQITALAGRRDGKAILWRSKETSHDVVGTWYTMGNTMEFDFGRFDYCIAPNAPRKPAELWMNKFNFGLAKTQNLWGPDGICFREVGVPDKEADERAAILIATRGGYNIDNTMRDFCVGFRAALKYRDNGSNLP